MSHQIITDLNNRYTAKKYDEEKRISQEDMAIIKEAIRLSASSINSQPWKFIVIESDEAKQRFHDTFANMHQFNQPHAKAASHTILLAHDPKFTKEKFAKRVDAEVTSGHLPARCTTLSWVLTHLLRQTQMRTATTVAGRKRKFTSLLVT